jgi:PAS domain S-box-containing protein
MLPALIVLLGVGGYFVTRHTIDRDRDADAARRAQVESVRTQGILARARAYVVGLGNVLAGEPERGQRRFAQLAGSTAGSVGLVDALWVERVPHAERSAYERRLGLPVTRLTGSGRFEPAPPAAAYLAATFTTGTRAELRRGVDVSGWSALAAAIRSRASVYAVSASSLGSLGGDEGFYLLQNGSFGRRGDRRGYLAVFVPRGWLTLSLEDDPRQVAISIDGRRLEGGLSAAPVAGSGFDALSRRWRIDVGSEPPTALQSVVPWLALAWPLAAALIALLVGRGILRRRRAEREAERIFDLSLDLLCVAGLDGYYKRLNPAFERTLGYSRQELLSRPFFDFVHPDDRAATREAMDRLAGGHELVHFENRYVRPDGSERLLEWSVRPVPERGLVYGAARDVTERRLLDDEQAALRRVATLVARGVSPSEVFAAVAAEIARLLGADATKLLRYEQGGTATVVAAHSEAGVDVPLGTRMKIDGENVAASVWRTGEAARMDGLGEAGDSLAALLGEPGVRSELAAPIVVEGRLWGAIAAAWTGDRPASTATAGRMANFTELAATAVANAESRAELSASRARVVAAGDETRRRIERDLHDGTQQRLVSLALGLRATQAKVPPELDELRGELADAAKGLTGAVEDLQEISRGIHPAILSKGGLGPALKTLARRSPVPVELDVHAERRLPQGVEAAAYYVVSEALTNAAKHAHASVVHVDVHAENAIVELAVRDDGVGGADPEHGSGLIGLRDRVEALGGSIEIASSARGGTCLQARIPIAGPGATG